MSKVTKISSQPDSGGERKMLADSGYSEKAIAYYMDKPYMGDLPEADQVSEMLGSCGDTMKIALKITGDNIITDVKYQVLGCPGAISAAMATVDLIKGRSLDEARKINDGDVFRLLEAIPAKKHHCIQLAVKTMYKAVDEYKGVIRQVLPKEIECPSGCQNPKECCQRKEGAVFKIIEK